MLKPTVRARRPVWLALAVLAAAATPVAAQTSHAAGKIAISTTSEEARTDFVKGRQLAENLRLEDSRAHFRQAIAKDPNFALAHLNLANSSPTGTEFFEHLGHAVKLADKASPGERLVIRGAEAGANGDPAGQLELYRKLVADYPKDERAHFLLGGSYFGRQEYDKAIAEYNRATKIAPDFAPAYNIVGYAYRTAGRYGESEQAFKKYIQLIPDDPNPYDSYAELLMKMGRFDESIAQYRKALEVNPQFAPSHIGIASNLMFQGKYDASRAEARKLLRRGAERWGEARRDVRQHRRLHRRRQDRSGAGRAGEAVRPGQGDGRRGRDVGRRDLHGQRAARDRQAGGSAEALRPGGGGGERLRPLARGEGEQQAVPPLQRRQGRDRFRRPGEGEEREPGVHAGEAHAKKNLFQIRLGHEVAGMISLAEKNWDGALSHLAQANLQDPYNLYRQGLAYEGKGDQAKAKEMYAKAVGFNQLPTINSAFVRLKARKVKV